MCLRVNSLLFISLIYLSVLNASEDKKIVRAVLESCPGCQLNRLQDVRAFVYDDLPKYEEVEFKKIQGAPPVLIFYNQHDEEVERHPLREKSREECNDLLTSRGFKLIQHAKEF